MTRISPLNYLLKGTGEEVITFIHADSLDHRMWQDQVDFFSSSYTVLTYDMRGFGRSPDPTAPFSHHEDLNELLHCINIAKTHLIGSSLGGEIALDFTATYPEMVSSVVLINSSLSGFKSSVNWDVGAKSLPLDTVKQKWLDHPVFKTLHQHQDPLKKVKEMVKDYNGSNWLLSHLRQKPQPPTIELLNSIKVSVCVMTGSEDLIYFQTIAKHLSNTVPLSKPVILEKCGHLTNLEDPSQVNQVISSFLQDQKP